MHQFLIDPNYLPREEPLVFAGPAGRLEGLWRPVRSGRSPAGAAVIAHPLPTHGGTMLNKVVFHTARMLHHDLDLATLRFNFRGTGGSEGVHDGGRGEVEDLASAWAEARRLGAGGLLVAAGFSFGAAMSLLAAARAAERGDPLPSALALIGLPLDRFPLPCPFPAAIPIAAVHGKLDPFTAPERVGEYLESWPGIRAFRVEPGADHFLEGALGTAIGFLSRSLREWI